jgi:hypothetical protein
MSRLGQKFQSIATGAITVTSDSLTISSGKQLVLGGAATEANQATNKQQLDAVKVELENKISMIAGGDPTMDTLAELNTILTAAQLAGVQNLSASINTVSTNLTTEASTRASADSDLQANIDSEASTRASAVSGLQANIDSEASTRAAADSVLQANIESEASTRAAADQELSDKIFKHNIVALSSLVVPDESQPLAMTVAIKNAAGLDGWYYKNGGPSSGEGTAEDGGRKVNWYLPSPSDASGVATGASLVELNMCLRLINKSSPPFITVYTKLRATGNAASWYHARYTYIVNDTSSLENNTNYLFTARIAPGSAVGRFAGFKKVNLTLDTFSSTANATLLPNDEILAITIGSDSSAAAGRVEFIMNSLSVHSTNGNYRHIFSNDPVVIRYLKHKLSDVFVSLGQPALLDV